MSIPFRSIVAHIIVLSFPLGALAQEKDSAEKPAKDATDKKEVVNEKCPVTGKDVLPKCTTKYEGKTYAFCSGECREKLKKDRANSLYQKIAGKAAISAAVDLFYKKVLADDRVNDFFEDINMKRQHNKQKAFFSAALGGPQPWTGKDMRKAHASLEIEEAHFNVIAEHLQKTLEELKVKKELIEQVMAVVGTTKDAVLNRDKKSEKKSSE
jgi:hemoglobin